MVPVRWEQSAVLRVEATSMLAAVKLVEQGKVDKLPAGKTVPESLYIDYKVLANLQPFPNKKSGKKSVKK